MKRKKKVVQRDDQSCVGRRPGPGHPRYISFGRRKRRDRKVSIGRARLRPKTMFCSPQNLRRMSLSSKTSWLIDYFVKNELEAQKYPISQSVYCHLHALTRVSAPLPLQGGLLHRRQAEQTMVSTSGHIKKARRALAGFVYDT